MNDSEKIAAIVDAALDNLHGETRLQALMQEFSTLEIMDHETNAFEVLLKRNEMPAFFRLYHTCPKKEFALWAVAKAGKVELTWQLIKAGANIDYAVYGAARANNIELTRKLIHMGANPTCATNGAKELAREEGNFQLYHNLNGYRYQNKRLLYLISYQSLNKELLVVRLAIAQGVIAKNQVPALLDFLNEFEDKKTQEKYAILLVNMNFYSSSISQLMSEAQLKKHMGRTQLRPELIQAWASLDEGIFYWLLYGSTRSDLHLAVHNDYILLQIAGYLLPLELNISDFETQELIRAARFNILGKQFIVASLLNYVRTATKTDKSLVEPLLQDVRRTQTIEELLVALDKRIYATQIPETPTKVQKLWTEGKNTVLGFFNSAPTPAPTLTAVLQSEKAAILKRFG